MKPWIGRFPRLALTLLAVLCLVPGTWVLPLLDRDEPRFSRATVEMNERGSFVVPYFNGAVRFDKPPLTYWCMEAGLLLFGKTEMGVRLHSVVSSWWTALVLFELAILMGAGIQRSFMAGAAWLTCLQVLMHGRLAVADVLMILWVVTAIFCLVKIGRRGGRWILMDRWFWGLVASLALGFLAKGPLAFIVPGLALGLGWLALRRTGKPTTPLTIGAANLALALIPALALVALWGIPALLATDGAYFDVGIGKHVVERGTVALNQRKTLPGVYYLVVMIPFLLPWTVVMPKALRDAWRSMTWERALMIGWFVAPFVIFSFYSTQLPHYVLPGYPALMLLIALMAGEAGEPLRRMAKFWRRLSVGLPVLIGVVCLVGGILAGLRGCDAPISAAVAFAGVSFLLIGVASERISVGREFSGLAWVVAACLMLWPAFEAARGAHLTLRLRAATGEPAAGVLRSFRFAEPSLVWYFQHQWQFRPGDEEAELVVVQTRRWRLDGDSLKALLTGEPILPVEDDTAEALAMLPPGSYPKFVQGWNPGKNSWLELAYAKRITD